MGDSTGEDAGPGLSEGDGFPITSEAMARQTSLKASSSSHSTTPTTAALDGDVEPAGDRSPPGSASVEMQPESAHAATARGRHPRHLVCGLAKSNSTASASTFSTAKSCDSVPVTGTLPYGSLQVHLPPHDPPQPPPAAGLLDHGDVFLLLDLPAGFTVGCDAKAMATRSPAQLLGLRDFLPGAHLVFLSSPAAMTRCGYWFVTRTGSNIGKAAGVVRIKQWDRYNEVLGEPASQVEARAYRDSLESFYSSLLPCSLDSGSSRPPAPPPKDTDAPRRPTAVPDPTFAADDAVAWHHLTSSISEPLLTRVTGKDNVNAATGLSAASEWLVDTADGAKGDANFAQASKLFKPVVTSELDFLFPRGDSSLDLRLLSLGSSGGEGPDDSSCRNSSGTIKPLPAPPPDSSSQILSAIRSGFTDADVIGEVQFAFLTAIHLGNLSCMEYWWHFVLRILLRAHQLVVARPALVRSLILTVHAQLVYSQRNLTNASPSDPGGLAGSVVQVEAAGAEGTSIVDMMPQNKQRLREALTLYKRRLNESLLGLGDQITKEQAAVGHAFADLEAWFWTYGWDLRSDYVREPTEKPLSHNLRRGLERGPDDSEGDEDDEYQPVVVELDESGREVGLVSFS